MKYAYLIFIILLPVVLITDYYIKKKSFEDKTRVLNFEFNNAFTQGYPIEYFYRNGFFPEKLHDTDSIFYKVEDFSEFKEEFTWPIIDPFNKEFTTYYYVPIYETLVNQKKPIGFLLLSAGPDGIINNRINEVSLNRTQLLKLYNQNRFSYYDYHFGGKDFLIWEITKHQLDSIHKL